MSTKNFKLTIQYDGTRYSGWQIQKKEDTVQGLLKECVQKIIKSKNVNVLGSGRTDAGVHSLGQVVNFEINTNMNGTNIKNAINANLPKDIRVTSSEIVDKNFNSRFSAKKREYLYMIKNSVSPFDYRYYHLHKYDINVDLLNECAAIVLNNNNFSNFCKHSQDMDNYLCSIDYSFWKMDSCENNSGEYILKYRIRANRFLHHMVRMLVGTMLEVSKDHITIKDFENLFKKDANRNKVLTAPSKGLYLFKVYYE